MSAAKTSLIALKQEATQKDRRDRREQLASVFGSMIEWERLSLPQLRSAAAESLCNGLPLT